jgi:hypothetical protein
VPRKKGTRYRALRELYRAAVRDVAEGQFALIAPRARELEAHSGATSGLGQNPRPFAERRIVTRVLVVTALEPRDPVRCFV